MSLLFPKTVASLIIFKCYVKLGMITASIPTLWLFEKSWVAERHINPLALELVIYSLAHHLCKM